ncbi:MAG: MFS transporter [Myxococcota bacterium]|jgi:MFS family permease|nr:MFS transporter [Myxococcota bacterium]
MMSHITDTAALSQRKGLVGALSSSAREVAQTFVHLAKAPRALWGINASYLLEGLCYFGVLTVLGKYLSEDVGLSDIHAGWVYSLLTGGITGAMLVLGGVSDKIGVRRTLVLSFACLILGRALLGASGSFFGHGGGAASPMFGVVLAGLVCIIVGFALCQPTVYAGVRQYTNKKTAAIGYAMVYAVMNLGAFGSGLLSPRVRREFGLPAVFWTYGGLTVLALLAVLVILTKRVSTAAHDKVKADNLRFAAEEGGTSGTDEPPTQSGETAYPKRKWDPLTICLSLALAAAGGGLLWRAIAAPVSAVKVDVLEHTSLMATLWEELRSEKEGNTGSFAQVLAKLHSAASTPLARPVVAALAQKGAREQDIDGQALEIGRATFRSDAQLLATLATLQSFKGEQPIRAAVPRAAIDSLRSRSLAIMAAAYGLVRPGSVNEDVLHQLRARQKNVEEDLVPMTAAEQAAAVRLGGQPPVEMLHSLADMLEESAASLAQQVPGEPGRQLQLCLQADASLDRELARIAVRPLSTTSRALSADILLSQATSALERARLLAERSSQAQGATQKTHADHCVERRIALAKGLAEPLEKALAPARFLPAVWHWMSSFGVLALPALLFLVVLVARLMARRPEHPLRNGRFTFFIFILVPAQTLFAHNWLTLPYYIDRAFSGTSVGSNFEFFSNLNPALIFVLTPLIAALTASANVYRMMILGTLVMAVPAFLLALPPSPTMLIMYIVLMTVGEAMWQPRFLQLVAEIAPAGRTGMYMGIAQLPWFLTKLMTGLYSGWFVSHYLPKVGPQSPELLWFLYACIAMITPMGLVLAKSWMGSYLEKKSA